MFDLSIIDEALIEMHIWCIKIVNVLLLVLQFNTFVTSLIDTHQAYPCNPHDYSP
jgi:hypothetical protein